MSSAHLTGAPTGAIWLPSTAAAHPHTHLTPRGGLHLLFKWRADRPVSNSEGQLKGLGINVRGNGGYVIAPPSRRADGRAYEIAEPLDIFNVADAPEWLYDLILTKPAREAQPELSISRRAAQAVQPPALLNAGSRRRYAEAALRGETQAVASAPPGQRNHQLNTSAFKLGTLVAAGELAEHDVAQAMYQASVTNGAVSEHGQRPIIATINSGLGSGMKNPRQIPEREPASVIQLSPRSDPAQAPQVVLETKLASSFKQRAIRWLWQDRFALGKLGLIGGMPDKGKGLISCDLFACVTNGHPLPCGEGHAPQGSVLYFTAEDDIEDTVIPRLIAAGVNLERVHIVQMARENGKSRTFSMVTDLEALKAKLEEIGDVVLVVIDPMSSYVGIGKVSTISTTDVRGFLKPLTDLAAEKGVSILGIMHFNKKADVADAMLRIADSLAYVAAARHVYVVLDDTEVEHRRLFVKAKNNLAPDKKALSYMTGVRKTGTDADTSQEIWAPHTIWGSEYVEVTANEAMQAGNGGKRASAELLKAKEFLEDRLAQGAAKQKDILEEAIEHDISEKTLRRAKKELEVKSSKPKGVDTEWMWALPAAKKHFFDRD